MYLSSLWEYPVKSCQSRSLDSACVTPEGFINDRRYLFVTPEGRFVTQREFPKMVKIVAYQENQELVVELNGKQQRFAKADFDSDFEVTIWKDRVIARLAKQPPSLVADFLGIKLALVELPNKNRIISDASANGHVSFADGLPYLLTTSGSLAELNSRLEKPVNMLNFRPNLVIKNQEAFAEDSWQRIQVGEVTFRAVKPCSRCIMTTVDTSTGEPSQDREPLVTLASYRNITDQGIIFGMNLIAENNGWIHLQDPVEVLD
ncbi:MAG: MOSC domain-containing protein [Enterobacterales bacterium]|nr:MOSC domain-containing protein [Enterobacterales bacterium]